MDQEEFYEYISKLWAMIIWGNKHYIIDKYINDNGFETLKKSDIHVMLTGSADTSMEIVGYDEVDGKREPNNKFYGIATSMTEMAAIRGFNGAPFSDWVLDEFIPEKLVITREAEGDGFLNAHISINGNSKHCKSSQHHIKQLVFFHNTWAKTIEYTLPIFFL